MADASGAGVSTLAAARIAKASRGSTTRLRRCRRTWVSAGMGVVLSHACEVSCRVGARKCSVTDQVTSPRARQDRAGRSSRAWNLWVPHSCPNRFEGTPGWAGLGVPGVVFDRERLEHALGGVCHHPGMRHLVIAEHHGGVRRPFGRVAATPAEVAAPAPGDGLVPEADVVMDRGFDLPAGPEQVWPWIVQLGKGRGGWYLPPSRRTSCSPLAPGHPIGPGALAGPRRRRRHPRLRRSRGQLRGGRGRAARPWRRTPRLPVRAWPGARLVGDHAVAARVPAPGCTCASGSVPYDGSGWPGHSGDSSTR